MMGMSTYTLISDLFELFEAFSGSYTAEATIFLFILYSISILVDLTLIIASIGGISIYSGKNKFMITTGIVTFVTFGIQIAQSIYALNYFRDSVSASNWISMLSTFVFFTTYTIYVVFLIHRRRKRN
jgi:hypothetical protein